MSWRHKLDFPSSCGAALESRRGEAASPLNMWRGSPEPRGNWRVWRPAPHVLHKPGRNSGFTLLEVLVSLTVLAIGAALALSLISGSLGNIRKVQLKTRTVEHAEAVMELALLDDSNSEPRSFNGDFEDGTRWTVRIENYEMPVPEGLQPRSSPQNMPVKLLSYTVEMFDPESGDSDYSLQTLKLVRATPANQPMRIQ